jgi:hypothetical protein
MLSVFGYGFVLFFVELIFLVVTTTSIDVTKPMTLKDVMWSLVKFYVLNVLFIAILTQLPSN